MDTKPSSVIPIQHKLNQKNGSSEDGGSIWNDMHGWMEQRQKEWDQEMAQLKNEFFSLKTATPTVEDRTSSRSSDASFQDRMSSISGGGGSCCSSRGLGDITRGRTFRQTFDVSQFEPEEIHVGTQENSLIVRAKHEEKHDRKSISREFNRRVDIPANVDPQTLQCFVRDDGTLLVEAELTSPSYESSSYTRDSPSLMENSSAHSVFSDRLSDRDTYSPPRADREDAFSPSSLDWSIYRPRRELDGYSPHVTDRDTLTPRRTDPDRDIYSWPKVNGDVANVPRMENSQRAEHANGNQAEYRNDLVNELLNYQRRLETVFPQSAHDGTVPTERAVDPAGYSGASVLPESRFQGAVESDHRPWRSLAEENGNTVTNKASDPDTFSVVLDVGTDFEPHELVVKTVDRVLVVHARCSNPYIGDQSGKDVYREFDLPHGIEPETITANLTPEGILLIEAPTNNWSHASRNSNSSHDPFLYHS